VERAVQDAPFQIAFPERPGPVRTSVGNGKYPAIHMGDGEAASGHLDRAGLPRRDRFQVGDVDHRLHGML
jgi:hypothetical protein